jgi:hypothetical protein
MILLALFLIVLLVTACNSLQHSSAPSPVAHNTAASTPLPTTSPAPTPSLTELATANIRGPYTVPRIQPTPTIQRSSPSQAPGSYTSTQRVTATSSNQVVKSTISTDVTTTVSCGSADCFDQHFSNCTPATMTADAGGLGSVSDQINGPASGGCSVTFMYTQNINPAWVNQPLTCTLDNTMTFQTSFDNTFGAVADGQQTNCTGPLVPILKPAPPSGSSSIYLYPGSTESAVNSALSFQVASLTASQVTFTVTDVATSQSQTASLNINSSISFDGYTMTLASIQQITDGTVDGQPSYTTQATLNLGK